MSRLKLNRRVGSSNTEEQSEVKKTKVKKKDKESSTQKERLPVFAKAPRPDGELVPPGENPGDKTADSSTGAFKTSGDLTGSPVKLEKKTRPEKKTKQEKRTKNKPAPKEAAGISPVHKRRVRLVDEEKTATVKEVNAVVKTSIFAEPESSELDRDYILPTEGNAEGLLAGHSDYDDYGGAEEQPLRLSKEIADAFGIKKIVEPEKPEEETPSIFAVPEEEPVKEE